ncbi:MAG: branched-chain amino acid aminotransferase [Crocinitomicaceae bacterium]|nr:branched-chain amino acid aminotransferase [Crocinitomicaceae bacterium]
MITTENMIEIRKTTKSRLSEVDFEHLEFGKIFSDHMFVAEYREGQWRDAVIRPYGPLSFTPAISALHYGQAIFEGLKAYKNERNEVFVFRPEKNAARLNHSAERLCMPDFPEDLFVDAVAQLVKLDNEWIPQKEGESLYIRPHMFATDESVGVRPSEKYLFVIFTCPVGKYYANEIKVRVETHYTRAARGGTGSAKAAGNYATSLLPTRKAQKDGFNQLLWTDALTHEYFEESGTMNVIFLSENKVITPEVSGSILDGITRDSVLTIARDWGYEVEERPVSVKEIVDRLKKNTLDAAFGVGTAATIAPINTIQHNGTNYQLKSYHSNDFAQKIAVYLDRLKRGLEKDQHGWIKRVM